MKTKLTTQVLVLAMVCGMAALAGCASHKPKSTSRIIPSGEENPQFHYAPERAGETIRYH